MGRILSYFNSTPGLEDTIIIFSSDHGDYGGNPALLVEIRQDLLARPEQQDAWAQRLTAALAIDIALGAVKRG